eukprot:TRINITY_DN43_c1_g2_i1.p1 TRINITY_DN43_c1_g2~~TRINITY_DN43_c1_g2_i1.p1  ORF type:complete len:599 (-),score=308.24 TRINITY_DN43_c1_g2_i1:32-1828(-)
MPPKRNAKKQGAKKSAVKAKKATKIDIDEVEEVLKISEITTTGALTTRPDSRDIKFENFTLTYHGKQLISDTIIELNWGRTYGLIGFNGTGKSTFLEALATREIGIPERFDIYLLKSEAEPSERTALRDVIDEAEKEVIRLEKLAETILDTEGPESLYLLDIYDRLTELDPQTFEKRAAEILFGLGFSPLRQNIKTKDLSGGWRMRVALAKALFIKPSILLLDEPTNHLDLSACVWLEDYLKTYGKILILISHSQDFLNGVCSNIMHLHRGKLFYYTGNYDMYVQTRAELERNQSKAYNKQQEDIAHIKAFIASCGTYANLVKQGKSKQKIIDKMEAKGLVEKVFVDPKITFFFPSCDKLPPPVLQFCEVAFSYSGKREDFLYENLDFGIDMDSRIALVGPNGAGKSTLVKLMVGDLTPTLGVVKRHNHLVIGRYYQHSVDLLDLNKSPLEFMRSYFAERNLEEEHWRGVLGRFGITGTTQTTQIDCLSGGQKTRIVFAVISNKFPNMLLLDEPTNHLDMECIDALAAAINDFEGGVVLVSHDFRLLAQVAKEIWVCDNKCITKWEGTIHTYKQSLRVANKTSTSTTTPTTSITTARK